jgi:hypothetical protein
MSDQNSLSPAPSGPTDDETLFGGVEVMVQFIRRDPAAPPPAPQKVLVRQLTVEDLKFAVHMLGAEPPLLAEFMCGRPDGWAATLTLSSLRLILDEGERINADFFAVGRKHMARLQATMPGIVDKLVERLLPGGSPSGRRN